MEHPKTFIDPLKANPKDVRHGYHINESTKLCNLIKKRDLPKRDDYPQSDPEQVNVYLSLMGPFHWLITLDTFDISPTVNGFPPSVLNTG